MPRTACRSFSAEGVSQAMWDALDLYEALCLENFGSLNEALASFEKKMCTRASAATEDALAQTEALHAENNPDYMVTMFDQISG